MNQLALCHRLLPRACKARQIARFDRDNVVRRLFAEENTHGDFRIAEQVARPSSETRFDVATDGEHLYVSVLYFEAGEYFGTGVQHANDIGAGNHGVEVLIAPCGDQLGYLQFGVGPGDATWVNHFWPYLDDRPDLTAPMDWTADFSFEHLHADLAWIVFFRFPLAAIHLPGYDGPLGFNVMRTQLRHNESAAWNTCSGSGFSDGTSCGWLFLEGTPQAPHLALSEATTVALHGTYDWPDNMVGGPYTPDTLRHELRFLRDHGMTRVYFLDYPEREISFAFENNKTIPQRQDHYRATMDAFGEDLMTGICRLAKEEGLQFYTICKPYDLGSYDTFAKTHDKLSFRRHPDHTHTWSGTPLNHLALCSDNAVKLAFAPNDIQLFHSPDNTDYLPLTGVTVQQDGNRLIFSNLNLTSRYLAVVFPDADEPGHFGNKECRLAQADLPAELARFARPDWQAHGFAYEMDTHAAVWSDQDDFVRHRLACAAGSVLGLRFGHEPYLRGMLDPSHAQVRQYWLDTWIQRAIDAGADGVDIRIAHHHLCTDWSAYAYAQPVIETFRRQHSRDPQPADFAAVQQLRGEFHTQFLRDAKALLAPAGLKLEAHLEARMKVPPEHRAYTGITWDVATWINEGIVDGLNLKYIGPGNPWLQRDILPRTRAAGIPVHAIAAIGDPRSQPRTAEWHAEWLRMCRACGIDALNLYELWVYLRTTPRGDWLPRGSAHNIFAALKEELQTP